MPATPYNDTGVVDSPWDGPANEARLSNAHGKDVYEQMYAWRDPDADPDTKVAYSLPHHMVDARARVQQANVNAVRNALSRLPQSNIPQADRAAVESHLQRHLDKFNASQSSSAASAGAMLRLQAAARAWAIDPRTLPALCELSSADFDEFIASRVELLPEAEFEAMRGRASARAGDVATVPLKGVLMPPIGGLLGLLMGAGGLQAFQSQLSEAANDPEVGVIVLDVDSPGGMVDQIPETAEMVRAAKARKPVVAVANTQAASAAYWLASQADEIVVTPSGDVGSIGVYTLHRDLSEQHAMKGIAPTLISAGKYKVEGNPFEPLNDSARSAMQADVDDYYRMFTGAVADGRGVSAEEVRSGYGEGRSLHAKQAVSAGLADRVATLADTVRRVTSPAGRAALDKRRADPAEAAVELPAVTYTPDERERLLTVMGQHA